MMPSNIAEIPLYHITHIDNLQEIITAKGLWCDRERLHHGFHSINIAHQDLKDRRMKTVVPPYTPATLGDFVPFYFTNRSPMLYAIHTGYVEGYTGGEESIIYLVTDFGKLTNCGRMWCYTDGHAAEAISSFFTNSKDLVLIDWAAIDNWSWKNTEDDNDKKRRKQAEFLVRNSVPFSVFSYIAVKNETIKTNVLNILAKNNIQSIEVKVEDRWYY